MKIAFFTDTYRPQLNGVTVSIDHFKDELIRQGHTVYIFAPRIRGYKDTDPNVFRLASFKVLSSEPEARFPFPVSKRSLQEIFRQDFDLVHAHGNGAFSLLGHQVARMKGVPFVLTFHTLHTKYTHYFLKGKIVKPRVVAVGLRMFGNVSDGVITPSEKMKKELISYGVRKPIKVIPNFVVYDRFQIEDTHYLHTLLSLPQNSPILLTVGRLGKEKNFSFIIKTFKKLAHQRSTPHLVIIGEGPEKIALRKLVRQLDISSQVHILGAVPYEVMPQVYKDSTLFVFTSTTETQGICVLEAASAGLPVVVVKDPAYVNIIKNGVNGYTLPLVQKDFVEKIEKLLADQALRKKMGTASRHIAQRNFHGDKLTRSLIALYTKVLAEQGDSGKVLKFSKAAVKNIIKTKRTINKIMDQFHSHENNYR